MSGTTTEPVTNVDPAEQIKQLKTDLERQKLKVKALLAENNQLRKASVDIQARAEVEEERISNALLKQIESLKREKETLAQNFEVEEEAITNELSRKLNRLQDQKKQLTEQVNTDQESHIAKLIQRIHKLENETHVKQSNLERLRIEKFSHEIAIEKEQESLVNRLWKRMDAIEKEKKVLQDKLAAQLNAQKAAEGDTSVNSANQSFSQGESQPPSSQSSLSGKPNLQKEVKCVTSQLDKTEAAATQGTLSNEDQVLREENQRLLRRLQLELERRQMLCKHLSESESSLEMEHEQHFNSEIRQSKPHMARATSPAAALSPSLTCLTCGQLLPSVVKLSTSVDSKFPKMSPLPNTKIFHSTTGSNSTSLLQTCLPNASSSFIEGASSTHQADLNTSWSNEQP